MVLRHDELRHCTRVVARQRGRWPPPPRRVLDTGSNFIDTAKVYTRGERRRSSAEQSRSGRTPTALSLRTLRWRASCGPRRDPATMIYSL